MEKDVNTFERQTKLLEELVKWTKVANYDKVKEILARVLDDDNKKNAYMLTGKGLNRDKISTKAKINKNDLTKLWKLCIITGLVEKVGGKRGKYYTLFNLEDFDLVPTEGKNGKKEDN